MQCNRYIRHTTQTQLLRLQLKLNPAVFSSATMEPIIATTCGNGNSVAVLYRL